jgi:hypothetical protein
MIVYLSALFLIFIKLLNMNHSPIGYDMGPLQPCIGSDVVLPALFYLAKASITLRLPDRATPNKAFFFKHSSLCNCHVQAELSEGYFPYQLQIPIRKLVLMFTSK